MSLADILFGQRGTPPVGTPPIADPTMSGEQPQRRGGIGGFLNEVFNPTNGLGQFGQALIAAGGDPGDAMQLMMQQNAARGKQGADFADWQRKYEYERANPKERADDVFTRTLTSAGIDPASEQGRNLFRQRAATMASPAPQMIGDAEHGYNWVTPPSQVLPGAIGTPPQSLGAELPPGWKIEGGGAGNGAGGFRVPR